MDEDTFVMALRKYVADVESQRRTLYNAEAITYSAMKWALERYDREQALEQMLELGHA